MSELNDVIEEVVSDAEVVTVPIDDTLSISGEAADAKAVGDALALKADLNQIVAISVNGETPDNQGAILIDGGDIPLSNASGAPTMRAAVETIQGWDAADIPVDKTQQGGPSVQASLQTLAGRTAATIPMSSAPGADMISAKIAAMDQTDLNLADAIRTAGSRTGADIAMDSDDPTSVKAAIEGRLKSVNGLTGDEDGNVQVDEVPFADNLRSQYSQNVTGTFSARTTGGEASVGNGSAWLTEIRGNRVHTGYVPETLNMTVTLVPREEGEDTLTAVLDEDTFKEEVTTSAVVTLAYTTEWSANPAIYGITLTGTPKSGDQITVVYVAETRGTITQSAPTGFVSTGWNLYNHTAGYAKVIKYSTMYGFCIEGTYTSLAFSATLDGAQSVITPAGGYFNVPSNGYVWVTGGTSTDTEIYMTWGDWIDPDDHPDFAAYSETTIDLSTIMSTYFPYGLLRVGDIRDEINLNVGVAVSNVERLAYSAENLATAKASGREYEYDQNYIYLERLTPVISEISLDGEYTANDHGMEYFTGTTIPVYAITLYGQNLKNKLERDVVTKSGDLVNSLTSTSTEKALTAAQGKALKDITDTLNSNLTSILNRIKTKQVPSGSSIVSLVSATPERGLSYWYTDNPSDLSDFPSKYNLTGYTVGAYVLITIQRYAAVANVTIAGGAATKTFCVINGTLYDHTSFDKHVECGSVGVAAGGATAIVAFKCPFENPPIIVANAYSQNPTIISCNVASVSTTGANIYLVGNGNTWYTGGATIYWIAYGV